MGADRDRAAWRMGRLRLAAGLSLALAAGPAGPLLAEAAGPVARTEPAVAARLPPAALAASLSGDATRTVLTVTLSGPVPVSSFCLEGPDRAVVEIGTSRIALPPDLRRTGLVKAARSGAAGPDRGRIVLDLAGPARIERAAVEPGPVPGSAVLVVELAGTSRAQFRASLPSAVPDPDSTGSLGRPADGDGARRRVIAIDAGHGGSDPGATGAGGVQEKDLTLAFAGSLRDALPGFAILMTRADDTFVPLDDRVARARAAGAELFISIHADSISRPSVAGATVYTGAERASDAESARLAERENRADRTAEPPPADVLDILGDLTLRETRGFSRRFAQGLLSQLGPVVRLNAAPHREAGFRVLRAADMPAVLVELGYLSNSRDAALMGSEAWRRRTTDAMARAVERFFAGGGDARAAVSP